MELTKQQIKEFSNIKKYPRKTWVSREGGDVYYDEPIRKTIGKVKDIIITLAGCFKNYFLPKDIKEIIEYKRHILKWIKPDSP